MKAFLSEGKVDRAKDIALNKLHGTSAWDEVAEMFRVYFFTDKTCPVCGGEIKHVWMPKYLVHMQFCPRCSTENYEAEVARRKEETVKAYMADLENVFASHGVPRIFWKARLSDFGGWAQKFRGHGVFVYGVRGVGKTHFAVALAMEKFLEPELIEGANMTWKIREVTIPVFVSVPDLLLNIRNTYNEKGGGEKELLDFYSRVRTLIIDDLGVEKTTEWALQVLYLLIDRRYREGRVTIFTSNLSLAELQEKLDERISSRIYGMCKVVRLTGEDRRKERKREADDKREPVG